MTKVIGMKSNFHKLKVKLKAYKTKKHFLWFLFLFIRYTLIYLGAWQVDIVVKDYIWNRRFDIFYFWFWQLSYWDAYALFFWTFALGSFLPEIVFVVKKLSEWRVVLVG